MFIKSILMFLTWPLFIVISYFLIKYLMMKYEKRFETENPPEENIN